MIVDISKKSLEVCHKNCEKHNSKANLIHSDMFKNVNKKYDVIISNPPYIRTTEEIEDIVKVCGELGISLSGTVFLRDASEIRRIHTVCQKAHQLSGG